MTTEYSPISEESKREFLEDIASKEIKTIAGMVFYILRTIEDTRNNDKLLCMKLWKEFYNEDIIDNGTIYLYKILTLPAHISIVRFRCHIQNKLNKYIPTNYMVARRRRWMTEAWMNVLGYNKSEFEEEYNLDLDEVISKEEKEAEDRLKRKIKNSRL